MNSIIKLNSIILLGLLPAIACMILCIFILDAYVIYGCTLLCAIYLAVTKLKDSFIQPNIIFMHSFFALSLCSLVKITSGNALIPDKAVPITLEVIIFCSSLLYIGFPHVYKMFDKFIFYKISILNQMGSQIIVIFSMGYIFLSCMFFLLFSPISPKHLYWLTHIIPPIVYTLCIVANYFTIKTVIDNYNRLPIIRIIAINNGKILISKRQLACYQSNKLDTPIEDMVLDSMSLVETAKCLPILTLGISMSDSEPRFSIKYISSSPMKKDVLLFILPIVDEKQIKMRHCSFKSPQEIKENIDQYSSFMREEIEHLSIAAKMWKENSPLDD